VGAAGLRERSHAPVRHGQAHDVAVVQAVLMLADHHEATSRGFTPILAQ
jgi:hypothetical protein